MKTQIHNLFIILAIFFTAVHQAGAQGTTAFTYQGQLHDNGTNANGTYTMIFKLYDSSSGGTQIGTGITNTPTLLNGLFTVNLDFGTGAFNGAARYLDITVSNGVAQTLSPRVQVLPTPYALYAANANVATVAATAPNGVSLGGTNYVPTWQSFPTNGTFVVPPGVTKILIEAWGGGGGGGGEYDNGAGCSTAGGGGGGGAYSKGIFTVTPGASYPVTVGAGGAAGVGNNPGASGGNGGDTSVGTLIRASGGYGGGNGPDCSGQQGCGGGGSGGGGGGGGNYFNINGSGALAGCDGGYGGSGAQGGSGGAGRGGGSGSNPGGGGGGSDGTNGLNGGQGARGLVIIYY